MTNTADDKDQIEDALKLENDKLRVENEHLVQSITKLNKRDHAYSRAVNFIAGRTMSIILGWQLNSSIHKLRKEIKADNVKRATVSDVLYHIIWRLFKIAIVLIPSGILIVQVLLMRNQNKLLDIQNEKVDQQNQLIESQRRSSYVFMMGNIMDAAISELRAKSNVDKVLSQQLCGQIISLSHALIPYRFILDDKLTEKSYSPERGLLLVFLLQSQMNPKSRNELFKKCNFEKLYLEKLEIDSIEANDLDIFGSYIGSLEIINSTVNNLKCDNCILNNLYIEGCQNCSNIYLSTDSILRVATIRASSIIDFQLNSDSTESINFYGSNINQIFIIVRKINNIISLNSQINLLRLEFEKLENLELFNSKLTNVNTYGFWRPFISPTDSKSDQTKLIEHIPKRPLRKIISRNSIMIQIRFRPTVDTLDCRGSLFSNDSLHFSFNKILAQQSIISTNLIKNNSNYMNDTFSRCNINYTYFKLSDSILIKYFKPSEIHDPQISLNQICDDKSK